MKGIILAAGLGTRLYPATYPISKILLPVYDRPMLYYPLSVLMMAGIRDILIITSERDHSNFINTLGDGKRLGLNITYSIQYVPLGIPDAFNIGEDFIGNDDVMLVLGDNITYCEDLGDRMASAAGKMDGAVMFGYDVPDPERFGVIEFDKDMNVISLEEKPLEPKSNTAGIGIYMFDSSVCSRVKGLKPSKRGEMEIVDLCRTYLEENRLSVQLLDKSSVWFDAGTFASLLETSEFIRDTERTVGHKILCPEEIAVEMGFVPKEEMLEASSAEKSDYYRQAVESIKRLG